MKNIFHRLFSGEGLRAALARALLGSAGVRILGMGFGFLVGVQLARGLGASGYGVYGLAMSIISMVSIPSEFGLPQLVTREVAADHTRKDWNAVHSIIGWAGRAVVILSIAVMLTGLVVWLVLQHRINEDLSLALLAGAALIMLIPGGNILGAALRGMGSIVNGQIPEIVVRPAAFSVLLMIVVLVNSSILTPATAIAMQLIASLLSLATAFLLLKGTLPSSKYQRPSPFQRKAWIRSAWPMALTESMRLIHGNISILILGAFAVSAQVGVFRVASSMGMLFGMPITLVHIVVAPMIAKFYSEKNTEKIQKLVAMATGVMVVGVSLLTLPFVFIGSDLIATIFGSEFREANRILLIISSGTVVGCMFGPGATLLNMTGHEKRVTKTFLINLVVLVVGVVPATLAWGATGTALVTSLAFVLWSALMWVDGKRLLGVDGSLWYASKYISVR